jgi:hypothetical protein
MPVRAASSKLGTAVNVAAVEEQALAAHAPDGGNNVSIAVGTPVLAATSKLGTAVNVAAVEEQALASHAANGGNNVSISVYPSPGSLP